MTTMTTGLAFSILELIVIMVLAIPLVAIICGTMVAMLRVFRGRPSSGSPDLGEEETRLIQDIHQGLLKMEERVEALETILLDRDRTDRKRN
jgi:phage shock protein B